MLTLDNKQAMETRKPTYQCEGGARFCSITAALDPRLYTPKSIKRTHDHFQIRAVRLQKNELFQCTLTSSCLTFPRNLGTGFCGCIGAPQQRRIEGPIGCIPRFVSITKVRKIRESGTRL